MPAVQSPSYLHSMLAGRALASVSAAEIAFAANLDCVAEVRPDIASSIVAELRAQRKNLKLIASENYSSFAVQAAMANLLTDKYAEGFPFKRFYAGCENIDEIEAAACRTACELFGAEHAYVQPHSGADANMIAFWAILTARVEEPAVAALGADRGAALDAPAWEQVRQKLNNQRMLGLDLASGGHLTHGMRANVSAKMFESHAYTVDRETGLLNYEVIAEQARAVRPLVLLAGYSAYPRKINFAKMRAIADDVGAVLMVDMAHFAGLVAGKVFTGEFDPVPFADVVTTTTHKTLRGPRGGLILCKNEFADFVDKGCPLVQGGPLPHVMAAKAICFTEALRPSFREYAQNVTANAKALATAFGAAGAKVISGTTENHLVLLDVRPYGLNGRQAENALRSCGLTLNRNSIPFDPNGAWYTSGLRLGTPAVTTLGMGTGEMQEIAAIIHELLHACEPGKTATGEPSKAAFSLNEGTTDSMRARVAALLNAFPVYPQLNLANLQLANQSGENHPA